MNSDKMESVEMASEGKAKKTFLENFSYIRREANQGRRYKVAGVLMAFVAIGISFFRGEPEKPIEAPAPMSIPSVGLEQVDLTKGNYSRAVDARQLDQNRRSPRSGVPLKLSGPKLIARSRNLQVPPGTLVRAELVTGASNGAVKAILKDDVRVNGETLIEAGSTILGRGATIGKKPAANGDKKLPPSLRNAEVKTLWIPDKIESDRYEEGHYLYIIEKPATWRAE